MTDKAVIGLDPASVTGWAALLPDGTWRSGVWNLGPTGKDTLGGRCESIQRKLVWLIEELGGKDAVDCVYYEEASFKGHKSAQMVLYGLFAAIQMGLSPDGIPTKRVSERDVKKAATGNVASKKPDIVEAAKEKWPGFEPETHDEADARFVIVAGMEKWKT